MGNGEFKARIKAASGSGIFVASGCRLRSWKKVKKMLMTANALRGAALDENNLSKAVPSSMMSLKIWSTLRTLDLSSNGLKCACVLGALGACTPMKSNVKLQGEVREIYPLEVLNLSGNSLSQLPPLLLHVFPKLRRLLCHGNKVPLDVSGGLYQRVGAGAALMTVDLSRCALKKFYLLDEASQAINMEGGPFPSLRELILDGNCIGGTFALVSRRWVQSGVVQFLELKNIILAAQQGDFKSVDPSVYVIAPSISLINVTGNTHQETIIAELRQAPEYKVWCERRQGAVTKQLTFTGTATLL